MINTDKYPRSLHRGLKDFTLSPPVLPLYIHYFPIVFKDLGLKGENSRIPVRGCAGWRRSTPFSSAILYISKLLIYIEFLRVRARGISGIFSGFRYTTVKYKVISCKTS